MATYRAFELASPPTAADSDGASVALGMEFYATTNAWVTELHFWQPTSNTPSTSTRTMGIYQASNGALVGSTATKVPSGSGWQTATLATAIALTANTRYVVVTFHPAGKYAASSGYFNVGGGGASGITNGVLTVPNGVSATAGNGTYIYNGTIAFPNATFGSANYWNDVTISNVNPAAANASPIIRRNPARGLILR